MYISSRNRRNEGFTLVEMLVVIAIIGILAALLMPGLRAALNSAHTVACTNNQKQLGVAFSMYAGDWNGYIVRAWSLSASSVVYWPPFLSGRQGALAADGNPCVSSNGTSYAQFGPTFVCPRNPSYATYKSLSGRSGWMSETAYGIYTPSNEVFNTGFDTSFIKSLRPNGTGYPVIGAFRLPAVKYASRTILLTDTVTGATAARARAPVSQFMPSYAAAYDGRIHLVHGIAANCLFFDFSVRSLSMFEINNTYTHPKWFWQEDGTTGFNF